MYFTLFLTGVICCWAATAGWAQEAQKRMLESLPTPATVSNQIPAATAATLTGDLADLGPQVLLERRTRATKFQVYSDSQFFYNSNVQLTPTFQVGDGIFFETLGASFTPQLLPHLTSSLYARHQFLRYTTHSELNFDAQTLGLSLRYPVKDWFMLYGGFSANRLYLSSTDAEFYKDCVTEIGLWRSHALNRRTAWYYGYQADWLAASPAKENQLQHALFTGLNLRLSDKLSGQLVYRLRGHQYLSRSRSDLDHLVALSLAYKVCKYASVNLYGTYGDNSSSLPQFDYRVFNAGGGLNLSVKF